MRKQGINRISNAKRALVLLIAVLAGTLWMGTFGGCSGKYTGSGTYSIPEIGGESVSGGSAYGLSEDAGDLTDVDTYFAAPGAGGSTFIYDSAYLGEVFGTKEVTLNDLYAAVDGNKTISPRFKELTKTFCKQYVTLAPKADRRILYYNLKTVTFKETDGFGLAVDSFSGDASACYSKDKNIITVLTEYSFDKGTWEYQTIIHELSHAARNAIVKKNGRTYYISSGGENFNELMCDETLNTIFSVSLLGYEEPDLAYQLQSNYMDIILDSMDNYEISDYINHSQSYFIKKLEEYSGQESAADMIRLLQAQYDDFHDDSFKREQQEYYPLYDFVSDVFYKNRIDRNSTHAEAEAVSEELIRRVTFDVPEEYELDVDHFREHFRAYCEALGIS